MLSTTRLIAIWSDCLFSLTVAVTSAWLSTNMKYRLHFRFLNVAMLMHISPASTSEPKIFWVESFPRRLYVVSSVVLKVDKRTDQKLYQELIGSFNHDAVFSWSDIALAVPSSIQVPPRPI